MAHHLLSVTLIDLRRIVTSSWHNARIIAVKMNSYKHAWGRRESTFIVYNTIIGRPGCSLTKVLLYHLSSTNTEPVRSTRAQAELDDLREATFHIQ